MNTDNLAAAAAELERLAARFDGLSITHPPMAMCFVKCVSNLYEPKQFLNSFPCEPPPEPWLSCVVRGDFDDADEPIFSEYVRTRALIYLKSGEAWPALISLASQAGRLLSHFPSELWPTYDLRHICGSPTSAGWRWFNMVFGLALETPRPAVLSVDDADRGGIFWWHKTTSVLKYQTDGAWVREKIRETGRYAATIEDMAVQSKNAVRLLIERATDQGFLATTPAVSVASPPPVAGPDAPPMEKKFTKEEKAMWWYEAMCRIEQRPLTEAEAYEELREIVDSRDIPGLKTPWSPSEPELPPANLSFESFAKYLQRCRRKAREESRVTDAGSVVQQIRSDGVHPKGSRVVEPSTLPAVRSDAARLRAAAAKQKDLDAMATNLDDDIEPPIDSQGCPI
jgi:hypothetical protein